MDPCGTAVGNCSDFDLWLFMETDWDLFVIHDSITEIKFRYLGKEHFMIDRIKGLPKIKKYCTYNTTQIKEKKNSLTKDM